MRRSNSSCVIVAANRGGRTGPTATCVSLWLALIIGFAAARPCQANDLEDVTAASDSLRTILASALADEDSDRLASLFTEDGAVITPTGRVVKGRLTLKTSAALLFMTMGGGEIEIKRSSISLIDHTAYETGQFVFRRSGDKADKTWQGSYTAVWKREAGQWKIAVAMGLR